MKRTASIVVFVFSILQPVSGLGDSGGGLPPSSERQADTAFANAHATPAAIALARRVIDAHGGIEAWQRARTVRYTQSLSIPGETTPWIATETAETAPARRLYQDWTSPGGSLVWDGHDVWTRGWKLGNPPKLMPFLNLNSLITPWLALDEGAILETSDAMCEIPGEPNARYETVTVRAPADSTRPPVAGFYRIFLDPKDGHMKAMSYSVTYGPLLDAMGLPPEMEEMGPITHVYDSYARVGGLLVPTRYHTVGTDGMLYGEHDVRDWAVGVKFDETRMKRPADAVLDQSSHRRSAKHP